MNEKTYKITWMVDSYDCELCGIDFAEGYVVECPDGSTIDAHPVAACYDGKSYNDLSAYMAILAHAGIEVTTVDSREEDQDEDQ